MINIKSNRRHNSSQSTGSVNSNSLDPSTLPLFGEAHPWDRTLNLIVSVLSGVLVTLALLLSFIFPDFPPRGNNWIHFCIALTSALLAASNAVLTYWYREGDLEPKVRKVIYFNAGIVLLLCIFTLISSFTAKSGN